MLARIARALNRIMSPITKVAHVVGVVFLAVMMFITTADVIPRQFNRPVMGTFELTQFMMAILVSLGLAYTAIMKANVSVDLVVSRFRKGARAIPDSIIYLVSLGPVALT